MASIKDIVTGFFRKKEVSNTKFTEEQQTQMEEKLRNKEFELEMNRRLYDLESRYNQPRVEHKNSMLPKLSEHMRNNIAKREENIRQQEERVRQWREIEGKNFKPLKPYSMSKFKIPENPKFTVPREVRINKV